MVSGGLAIMKQLFRDQISNEELVSRLFATADSTGIYAARETYGHGRMDLGAATSPVGVLVVDSNSRKVVRINHEACRIMGLQSGEEGSAADLGMVEFRRLDGTAMQPDEVPIERALRTGVTVHAEELVIVGPSGEQVTTRSIATSNSARMSTISWLKSASLPIGLSGMWMRAKWLVTPQGRKESNSGCTAVLVDGAMTPNFMR